MFVRLRERAIGGEVGPEGEVVAEAELGISYADSPIVAGDHEGRLAPARGCPRRHRSSRGEAGRAACNSSPSDVATPWSSFARKTRPGDQVRKLAEELREVAARSPVIDEVLALCAERDPPEPFERFEPSPADQLGVGESP